MILALFKVIQNDGLANNFLILRQYLKRFKTCPRQLSLKKDWISSW